MSAEFSWDRAGQRRTSALSYGPFGYVAAAALGFVVGSVAFLIADSSAGAHNAFEELPILLGFAGAGTVLMTFGAVIANWLIGRRIREQVELERSLFAGDSLPPMRPRPDVPGIMLEPRSAYAKAGQRGEAIHSPAEAAQS